VNEPTDTPVNPDETRPWRRRVARAACVGSLLLCVAVALAYLTRHDHVAAVTVFPPWVWCLPGLAIIWFARRPARRLAIIAGVVWLVYLVAMIDRPAALVGVFYREFPATSWSETPRERRIRVVSLNCGGGSTRAIAEVAAYDPDIVLLQESPGSFAVGEAARELFGDAAGFISGIDTSIIVRGEVRPIDPTEPKNFHWVNATVQLADGPQLHVVSLRLEPPLVRIDLWSPDCWRAQTANRRVRRQQLAGVTARFKPADVSLPLIVGGDFNAPPRDGIFELLRPRLRDAFDEAGLGWGNTITNVGPFTRIDQVWIDEHFTATTVVARRTIHSDHRMVIADLVLRE
jgi:vancomycin resistance protein VanJ